MTTYLSLDDQLCYSLYATSMAINRVYKPMLDRLGVTYPQYLVLSVLWEEDGLTIGAIANRLALESSTITPLVKRLEALQFVSRRRDTNDERRVLVTLTSHGTALRPASRCLAETLLSHSGMDVPDLIALNAMVRRLYAGLTRNMPNGTANQFGDE